MPPRPPHHLRTWLVRGLAAWSGATFVLAVAAVLWALLSLLGDKAGAGVARSIVTVAACGWLLAMAGLVALLAWERATAHDPDAPESSAMPPSESAEPSAECTSRETPR